MMNEIIAIMGVFEMFHIRKAFLKKAKVPGTDCHFYFYEMKCEFVKSGNLNFSSFSIV